MSINNSHNVTNVLNRLKKVFKAGTDSELAQKLGVERTVIANWKRRDSINTDLIVSKCEHEDLNWIFYGVKKPQIKDNIVVNDDQTPYNTDLSKKAQELISENERLRAQVEILSKLILDFKKQ